MKKSFAFSAIIILLLFTSCTSSISKTIEVTPSQTVTATEDVYATRTMEASIKETANAATEIASNATATVVQATEESLQTLQAQETATSVSETQQAQRAATQEAKNLQATQTAAPLLTLVEELNDEGVLHSTTGRYFHLDNFTDSWAQINWYRREPTKFIVDNFVIKAHIDYESASRSANWYASGCGFTFREDREGDHYLIYPALDGYVYFLAVRYGELIYLGEAYYGQPETPAGSLDLMLVIEDDWIFAYINDVKTLIMQNIWFTEGTLGYSLTSGINTDFGTRCEFSNVELWMITSE